MTKVVPALTARTQLGQIMKRATQKGERFVVDRRREPQVVIMGVEDYFCPYDEVQTVIWVKAIRLSKTSEIYPNEPGRSWRSGAMN